MTNKIPNAAYFIALHDIEKLDSAIEQEANRYKKKKSAVFLTRKNKQFSETELVINRIDDNIAEIEHLCLSQDLRLQRLSIIVQHNLYKHDKI